MKTRPILFAFLMVILASCAPAAQMASIATPTSTATLPTPTDTLAPTLDEPGLVATPLPTQPPITFVITPDAIQVEHWKEYQIAFVKCVLSYCSNETVPSSDTGALCEWDILGRSAQEVYVWAMCYADNGGGEKPLVIYLETDGSIREVEFGGYKGTHYNLNLFPQEMQEKMHLYSGDPAYMNMVEKLGKHLMWRLTNREQPPLIVLSATPAQ